MHRWVGSLCRNSFATSRQNMMRVSSAGDSFIRVGRRASNVRMEYMERVGQFPYTECLHSYRWAALTIRARYRSVLLSWFEPLMTYSHLSGFCSTSWAIEESIRGRIQCLSRHPSSSRMLTSNAAWSAAGSWSVFEIFGCVIKEWFESITALDGPLKLRLMSENWTGRDWKWILCWYEVTSTPLRISYIETRPEGDIVDETVG